MAVDLWHSALKRLSEGHERAALTNWISFCCLILYHMFKAADIQVSERLLIPSTASLLNWAEERQTAFQVVMLRIAA